MAIRNCFEIFQKFSWLDVFVFVCALGDFLVLSAPVLRQIARYLPHHTNGNASKTHPNIAALFVRSCFEFLQKVFLGLMYPFSCVLWAIFWSFSLLFFVR